VTTLPLDPTSEHAGSVALATEIHSDWDQAWPTIEQSINNQGLEIRCSEGCHGCCFDLKPCAHSEGLLIDAYLRKEFSVERQEHFRSRVESTAGCFRKQRENGFCDSADEFERAGGIECPFLERGHCAIYPVRPLTCRSMVFATPKEAPGPIDTASCRKCPASVVCLEAQMKRFELQARIDEQESGHTVAPSLPQTHAPSIAE